MNTNDADQILEVYVAGVMYEGRANTVRTLTLTDMLTLERQPNNAHDPNATRVVTGQGKQVGFIPRRLAAWLAPWLDCYPTQIICEIVELLVEPATSDVRLRIAFSVPRFWIDSAPQMLPSEHQEISYTIEERETGNYLFITCPVKTLNLIKDIFIANGIPILSSGYSVWPSESGKQYEWYIKVDTGTDIAKAKSILKDRLNLTSEEDRVHELNETRRSFQSEVQKLQTELRRRKTDLDEALNLSSQAEADKQRIIDELNADIIALQCDMRRIDEEKKRLGYQKEQLTNVISDRNTYHSDNNVGPQVQEVFFSVASVHFTPYETLTVIKSLYPNRVVILDTAFKSAKDSENFAHRQELFKLLWRLVTEYWQALCNGKGDDAAGVVFGNSFAMQETSATKHSGDARKARTFCFEGKNYYMIRHLKIGVKESTAETIRVHFDWDNEKRKLIIGHCGPHLALA